MAIVFIKMPHDRRALGKDKADFAQVRHEQRKRDRKDMKASRLIFTLLLASSVAVVQLAGQQTKVDQKPIEEVKAKAEAGDAEFTRREAVGLERLVIPYRGNCFCRLSTTV
jgi:hypothetical protein